MSLEAIFCSLFYVIFSLLPCFLTLRHAQTGFWVWAATNLTIVLVLFSFLARIFPEPVLAYAVSLIVTFVCFEVLHKFKNATRLQATSDFSLRSISLSNQYLKSSIVFGTFFLVLLFFLLMLRTHFSQLYFDPNRLGAEKLFNLQFINSFLHGEGYPPQSLWFADSAIGYYLLPKVLPGVFLKLVSFFFPSQNLLGLVFHISDCFWVAFASTVLAEFCSSFCSKKLNPVHYLLALLLGLFPLFGAPLRALQQTYISSSGMDLWSLSRIIENTVNEYPFWNFVWSDNHSHSNVIAFQLSFFFWFLRLLNRTLRTQSGWPSIEILLCAFSACAVAMSHSGSVFIDLCIGTSMIICYSIWHLRNSTLSYFLNCLSFLVMVTILLLLPDFFTRPQPNVKWYFVPFDMRSSANELLQVYFSQFLLFSFVAIFLGAYYFFARKQPSAVGLANTTFGSNPPESNQIMAVSAFMSLFTLIITPEFLASNWDMGEKYMRYNTLFRFLFESYYWAPLMILATIMCLKLDGKIQNSLIISLSVFLIFCYALFLPAQFKTLSLRTASKDQFQESSLDGLKWFQKAHPHDWGIISFLRNLKSQKVVVAEECGMPPKETAYTSLGRISALSGWPALCGWGQHVFLFQKPSRLQSTMATSNSKQHTWEQLLDREKWLKKLYSLTPLTNETAKSLLAMGVTHLVWGELEKKYSPQLSLVALKSRGVIVYEKDGYGVIKLTNGSSQPELAP